MKIAYIAHPVGAFLPENREDAQKQILENLNAIGQICREINLSEPNTVPFAPYYLDCVVMDDSNPVERQRGIDNDTALIKAAFISEIRLYGNRISHGMKCEIRLGRSLGIPIIAMTPETIDSLPHI